MVPCPICCLARTKSCPRKPNFALDVCRPPCKLHVLDKPDPPPRGRLHRASSRPLPDPPLTCSHAAFKQPLLGPSSWFRHTGSGRGDAAGRPTPAPIPCAPLTSITRCKSQPTKSMQLQTHRGRRYCSISNTRIQPRDIHPAAPEKAHGTLAATFDYNRLKPDYRIERLRWRLPSLIPDLVHIKAGGVILGKVIWLLLPPVQKTH